MMGVMTDNRTPNMPTAGPIGRTLITALEQLLQVRKMSQRGLAAALDGIGRPIPALGIARILRSERRVDVDELIALAAVLDVDPVTLLLPRHVGPDDVVELTPKASQRARIAWGWMRGRWPLPADLWPDDRAFFVPSARFAEFTERTRPDFSQPLDDPAVAEMVELQRLVELVLGDPDPVARWSRTRDTVLRRFRLAAIQLEELAARLDGEGLAAGVFEFDADAAQREIRNVTGWVRGPVTGTAGPATSGRKSASGTSRTSGAGTGSPHGAATSKVTDPFGERKSQ